MNPLSYLTSLFKPKPIRPFVAKIVEMLDKRDYTARDCLGWDFYFAQEENLSVRVRTGSSGRYLNTQIDSRDISLDSNETRAIKAALSRLSPRPSIHSAAIARIEAYKVVDRTKGATP